MPPPITRRQQSVPPFSTAVADSLLYSPTYGLSVEHHERVPKEGPEAVLSACNAIGTIVPFFIGKLQTVQRVLAVLMPAETAVVVSGMFNAF